MAHLWRRWAAARLEPPPQGGTGVTIPLFCGRRQAPAACTGIGRARPHRVNSHRGRCRFSGPTRIGRYSWARYYHPSLQRFISEDPIGFAGGDPNLYSYVFNQPTSFRDPTGLAVDPISWTAAAIMCGSGSVIGAVMAGRKATWDERLRYAGIGCAAGMLTLVSMIAAGGAVAVGTLPDIGLLGGTAGGAASAKTALEIAREGGRHSGFLRNYAGRSPTELRSAVASIERQIAQHRSWIANPEGKIPNLRALDPRQQAALLNSKWPGDIARQQEQLEILRGLLGGQ